MTLLLYAGNKIYFESQHLPAPTRKADDLHEFLFFKEELIQNTKSHFDIKLSKQKGNQVFIFMEIYLYMQQ